MKQRLKREAIEIVQLLLKHGVDPQHVNRTGKPVVASTTNAEIISLLGSG